MKATAFTPAKGCHQYEASTSGYISIQRGIRALLASPLRPVNGAEARVRARVRVAARLRVEARVRVGARAMHLPCDP